MFKHEHPYKPFIQKNTTKLIVGTLPPPRFSTGELLEKDVDFCYGSYYNSLWLFIDKIHNLNLRYDNSNEAIEERKTSVIWINTQILIRYYLLAEIVKTDPNISSEDI